jgi:GNAT superfamily N-acetyltransferase
MFFQLSSAFLFFGAFGVFGGRLPRERVPRQWLLFRIFSMLFPIMTVEPFTENDLPALDGLRPENWPDLVPHFQFYLSKPSCLPRKTVVDGAIVGSGAGIAFGPTGWLAHIIVRPEHRGVGIGGRIVADLMGLLAGKGCRTVSLIATDLGRPVYLKAGFVDQTEYVFLTRAPGGKEGRTDRRIIAYEPTFEPAVLELDRAISGETREAVLKEKLEGSFLFVSGGRLRGCFLPRLGEGLVIARDDEAGLALLELKTSQAERVAMPADNEAARAFLLRNGFTETMRARRMVSGPAFAWKPDCVYGRIGGNMG